MESLLPHCGLHEKHAACVLGARFVPCLHGVVEGSLRIEKLDERGFAAPIGVVGDRADIAGLREHVRFDGLERGFGRRVLGGRDIDLADDCLFQLLQPRIGLPLLAAARARRFPGCGRTAAAAC